MVIEPKIVFYHSNKTSTNTASVQKIAAHISCKATKAKSRPDMLQGRSSLHEPERLRGSSHCPGLPSETLEEELVAEQCSVIISLL